MSSLPQPPVPPNSVQLSSSLLPTFSFSAGNPILSYTINLQLSTERHSFFNRRLHVAFDSNPIYQHMSTKTLQRISCHANFQFSPFTATSQGLRTIVWTPYTTHTDRTGTHGHAQFRTMLTVYAQFLRDTPPSSRQRPRRRYWWYFRDKLFLKSKYRLCKFVFVIKVMALLL
jgi:hypothetical protein